MGVEICGNRRSTFASPVRSLTLHGYGFSVARRNSRMCDVYWRPLPFKSYDGGMGLQQPAKLCRRSRELNGYNLRQRSLPYKSLRSSDGHGGNYVACIVVRTPYARTITVSRRIRAIVPTQTCERFIKPVSYEQRPLCRRTSVYIMRESPRLGNP